MNDKIYEFATRADLITFESIHDSMAVAPSVESVAKARKFAELIVGECMWKIMQRKEDAIDNDWHVDEAMSAAISDISEHFGVEE